MKKLTFLGIITLSLAGCATAETVAIGAVLYDVIDFSRRYVWEYEFIKNRSDKANY